ncbi:hypothetical protein PROFUN_02856 [Planoprotostelium fungivorum]|uniref:Dolichyl-diphosphooligosaccharide--protein glycosyltransferase subunit OST2 n=1 Tax=Planoprotostelium fungivorum TaxID=1890364 RepID=A0A2P6NRX7_9EUKA|nr:hypothetical protein PROFUN_02856 [Planoprotostelium fungivorum]
MVFEVCHYNLAADTWFINRSSTMSSQAATREQSILSEFLHRYNVQNSRVVKVCDVFLLYVLLTGIIQFVYCCLVGTFPFNSFLSGFISTVGTFVLTVCLRIQIGPKSPFKGRSNERAFFDYLFANLILHLWSKWFSSTSDERVSNHRGNLPTREKSSTFSSCFTFQSSVYSVHREDRKWIPNAQGNLATFRTILLLATLYTLCNAANYPVLVYTYYNASTSCSGTPSFSRIVTSGHCIPTSNGAVQVISGSPATYSTFSRPSGTCDRFATSSNFVNTSGCATSPSGVGAYRANFGTSYDPAPAAGDRVLLSYMTNDCSSPPVYTEISYGAGCTNLQPCIAGTGYYTYSTQVVCGDSTAIQFVNGAVLTSTVPIFLASILLMITM